MSPTIQRLPLVIGRTGLGRTSIYNGVKDGTFPSPIRLGPRAVGWHESDITEWINSRQQVRGSSARTVTTAEKA